MKNIISKKQNSLKKWTDFKKQLFTISKEKFYRKVVYRKEKFYRKEVYRKVRK